MTDLLLSAGELLFKPLRPFIGKKGTWRAAKFPLIIQMVPKGGLDR
jgi:hypothetical protein